MEIFGPVLVFLIIAVVLILAIAGYLREQARRRALAEAAARLGLQFDPGRDSAFPSRFAFLDWVDNGANRYAENKIRGVYRDRDVLACDYHYETHQQTDQGRRTTHHWSSIYVLELPILCPPFRLYPENFLHRLGQALGAQDIDFESDEFSRAFVVKCPDKKFAYDVCHPRMMDFLLRFPQLQLQLGEQFAAAWFADTLDARKVEARLDILADFCERLPGYLLGEGAQ